MAYEGAIQFIQFTDVDFGCFYRFNDIRFTKDDTAALTTKLWEFCDCELEVASEASRRRILDSRGTERGWIMYDVEDGKDLRWERCVLVGRAGRNGRPEIDWGSRPVREEYHILVVKQKAENEYERVGIGRVQFGYLSRQEQDIRVY
jgi:hypothetical protein